MILLIMLIPQMCIDLDFATLPQKKSLSNLHSGSFVWDRKRSSLRLSLSTARDASKVPEEKAPTCGGVGTGILLSPLWGRGKDNRAGH